MRYLVLFFAFFTALLALSGCVVPAPPANLDVRTDRPTADGKYMVSLRPLVSVIPINQIHAWEITVRTAAGEPVDGAHISFDGGMPQHGHGFPTQPRVTDEMGNGRYRLDGVKFSMTGWWEMKLQIQAGQTHDQVTFNTVITTPAAERKVAAQ
jgi:hypothetical protein